VAFGSVIVAVAEVLVTFVIILMGNRELGNMELWAPFRKPVDLEGVCLYTTISRSALRVKYLYLSDVHLWVGVGLYTYLLLFVIKSIKLLSTHKISYTACNIALLCHVLHRRHISHHNNRKEYLFAYSSSFFFALQQKSVFHSTVCHYPHWYNSLLSK